MTYGDYIRRMSDKELADFLDRIEALGYIDSSILEENDTGPYTDMLEFLQAECNYTNLKSAIA